MQPNNKHQMYALYPTPLLVSSLKNDATLQEVRDTLLRVTFGPTPRTWGKTHKISYSAPGAAPFGDDIISYLGMTLLDQELHNIVAGFCAHTGVDYRPFTRTSWFSLFEPGDYGHVHTHSPCDISGCVYVETDGEDGSIFFLTPNIPMANSREYAHMTTSHKVKPEAGRVLVFPSFMEHGIQTNESQHRRISLAFNLTFK